VKLIWLRHGETQSNRQGAYLGHTDEPLSDAGIAQAERLARRLEETGDVPAAIYTSDLKRCAQTAEIVARRWGIKPQTVPALRELSFGGWEGLTYEELMRLEPERAARWYDDPFTHSPPNGESLRELGQRVDGWLGSLLDEAASFGEQPVVLVTHGGVIRWFQAAWMERDPNRYWQQEGLAHGEALVAVWNGKRWRQEPLRKGWEEG